MAIPGRERLAGTLFERIRSAGDEVVRQASATRFRQSICQNLQHILNTRIGSCQGTPELGIADFNDTATATTDFWQAVIETIQDCILRYEPRITHVSVSTPSYQNNPLDLHFHLVVQVNFDEIKDVLEFDLSLDNHQYFRMN